MLERPPISNEAIETILRSAYSLTVDSIRFLPIGCDSHAAVYRVRTTDGEAYFLKARRGEVNPITLSLPRYLHAHSLPQAVAPLPTINQAAWATLDDYALIVYPYIDGEAGMSIGLSDGQWLEYGRLVRQLHRTQPPPDLEQRIHTANLLITPQGDMHIVDWDQPVFAPKERDLMFIVGGSIGSLPVSPKQEALFFEGYEDSAVDPLALAYYRYEWVVQDLGAFAEPVFFDDAAGEVTRAGSVRMLRGMFAPGDVVEIARGLDPDRPST